MIFKTGLNLSPEPPKLKFGAYFLEEALPPLPTSFGHQDLYPPRGWGMLDNDHLGCCTVAGAMHAIMVWRAIANKRVLFTNTDVKEDYFAITGGEDTGVNMVDQASYWQKTGFRDSMGNRHKILAYMQVDPANLSHVDAACYLFDAVGLGVSVGREEEIEFQNNQPWTDPSSPVEGYHYVPMIGKDPQYRQVITWGGTQDIAEEWFTGKVSEVVAILTNENLVNGKSEEGFDLDALQADLKAVADA